MGTSTGWTSVFLLVACGGPAVPAESGGSLTPQGDEPLGAASELPGSDGDETPAKTEGPAPATSAESSSDDLTAILQLVIDDPELDNHLHLGSPGRFPLQVSGEKVPSGLKLVKSTEPVQVVAAPKSKKDAVLVFTEIDVQGTKATVRYRYDVEGIRGTVSLSKAAHGWELKNSRLVER